MADNILPEKLRAQIAQAIIKALERVLTSYQTYTDNIVDTPDEDFYEAHKNARTALAHMELLIKLAKGLGLRDPVIEQAEKAYLRDAQAEWDAFRNKDISKT
jgi:biotin carboxylase